MIGLDTNIILRALLDDDAKQSPVAQKKLEEVSLDNSGYVCISVMLETYWVLKTMYKLPKRLMIDTYFTMLKIKGITFENFEAIVRALGQYGEKNIDFSDALIAEINNDSGCSATYTFDKSAAQRVDGMELLT